MDVLRREVGPQVAYRGMNQDLMCLEEGSRTSRPKAPRKDGKRYLYDKRKKKERKRGHRSQAPRRKQLLRGACASRREPRPRGATGFLRRKSRPQKASRGGSQDRENKFFNVFHVKETPRGRVSAPSRANRNVKP